MMMSLCDDHCFLSCCLGWSLSAHIIVEVVLWSVMFWTVFYNEPFLVPGSDGLKDPQLGKLAAIYSMLLSHLISSPASYASHL